MNSTGKNIKEMRLKSEGIVCTGCAEDMERVLRETEGILEASVKYQDEIIYVKYDPDLIGREGVYMSARKLCGSCRIISES